MLNVHRSLFVSLKAFVLSLLLLAGCATQTPIPVGRVVVVEPPKLEPLPKIVQELNPKPAGYFQRSLRLYSQQGSSKPTDTTTPLPAAKTKP